MRGKSVAFATFLSGGRRYYRYLQYSNSHVWPMNGHLPYRPADLTFQNVAQVGGLAFSTILCIVEQLLFSATGLLLFNLSGSCTGFEGRETERSLLASSRQFMGMLPLHIRAPWPTRTLYCIHSKTQHDGCRCRPLRCFLLQEHSLSRTHILQSV